VRSIGTTKTTGSFPAASEVEYTYDAMNRLRTITRGTAVETLYYGPSGELMAKQAGTSWTFWVGDYATVSATIPTSCGGSFPCPATSVTLDAHVIFAGTRIASAGTPTGTTTARTLYYYRSRLGSVVATSLGGGVRGEVYRYTPYGAVAYPTGAEGAATRSELGYTNALRLSGNLLHLKTRVYDPEARIFLQVDSVDRHRYAYVGGDPANYSDPTGMMMIHDRQEKDIPGWTLTGEYDYGALPQILFLQTVARSEKSNDSDAALTVDGALLGALWSNDPELQKDVAIATRYLSKSAWGRELLRSLLEATGGKGQEVSGIPDDPKNPRAREAWIAAFGYNSTHISTAGAVMVYWDPSKSLVLNDGKGTQSPAMGLAHEAAHALFDLELGGDRGDKDRMARLKSLNDPAKGVAEARQWTRDSERYVIRWFEAPIARELNEPVRDAHSDGVNATARCGVTKCP
jgi:RHS repeat-associated protein